MPQSPSHPWLKRSFPLEIEKLPRPGVGVQNGNLLDLPDALITNPLEMVKIKHDIFSFKIYLNFSYPKLFKKDTSNKHQIPENHMQGKDDVFPGNHFPVQSLNFLGTWNVWWWLWLITIYPTCANYLYHLDFLKAMVSWWFCDFLL